MFISIAHLIRSFSEILAYSESTDHLLKKMEEKKIGPLNRPSFESLLKTREEGLQYFDKLTEQERKELIKNFERISPPLVEMDKTKEPDERLEKIVVFYKGKIVPMLKKQAGPPIK